MRLIVGLGNPGNQYAATRHNVGAWLVIALAKHLNANWQSASKFKAHIAEFTNANGQTGWLVIPTTYMNHSGQAIAALALFYKIPPEEILVAHDELDLPLGTLRLKLSGGHGGHNGLRSTIDLLHSRDFYRFRIGIGHPGSSEQVTPYVLGVPPKHEQQTILNTFNNVLDNTSLLLAGNMPKLMQHLNTVNESR